VRLRALWRGSFGTTGTWRRSTFGTRGSSEQLSILPTGFSGGSACGATERGSIKHVWVWAFSP